MIWALVWPQCDRPGTKGSESSVVLPEATHWLAEAQEGGLVGLVRVSVLSGSRPTPYKALLREESVEHVAWETRVVESYL